MLLFQLVVRSDPFIGCFAEGGMGVDYPISATATINRKVPLIAQRRPALGHDQVQWPAGASEAAVTAQ